MESAAVAFSNTWSLLGPFQIGTREAAWGADPLEYHGGFPSLKPDDAAIFKSSITPNGTVTWATLISKSSESSDLGAKVSLSVGFSDVDWTFLQAVYGWAALQWQAWARGEIIINGEKTQTVILYTDNVLEYAVDGIRHFGGDFYSFRKAPLVLHLQHGKHVIDLRLVRDVRAMGGVGAPTIDVNLELVVLSNDLEVSDKRVLVSDVVDGRLASPYGSVTVRNSGEDWIEIFAIADAESNGVSINLHPTGSASKTIAPGQTRPVAFHLGIAGNTSGPLPDKPVALFYRIAGQERSVKQLVFKIKLETRSKYEPQKVTHLHTGGIVSYAMLRPPAKNATCERNDPSFSAPVMLQFHGAGVEADNPMVAHALDPVPDLCAWVVFPTGVTPWSGDDWHNWGFADVEAAVGNIPAWIETIGWRGVGVDVEKWLVSGHSNGGQGTWYSLLHHPDKVLAAAPVSGYLSIQTYVPYQFWKPMDPRRRAVIEASANSYRHDLLASNAKDVPIYNQHGSADDNVPAYHSRLMGQLLSETGWSSNYSELKGKGHWFETVMTTDGLQKFYHEQLRSPTMARENVTKFELVVANPADMGSKCGVEVLYLIDPGQNGKVRVSMNYSRGIGTFDTENIFAFKVKILQPLIKSLVIEGKEMKISLSTNKERNETLCFYKSQEDGWTTSRPAQTLRARSQLGGIDAILRSKGHFRIVYHGVETFHTALQISRNLFQYFSADAEIVDGNHVPKDHFTGNIITLATGSHIPKNHVIDFPIQISNNSQVLIRRQSGKYKIWGSSEAGQAAIFVQPSQSEALELVVWGRTTEDLDSAARLTPLMTGIGQPDFILLGKSSKWKGVEGCSLGFFDAYWDISSSSVLG